MGETSGFQFNLAKEFPHLAAAPIVEAVIHWTARPIQPFVPDVLRKQLEQRLGNDYPKIQAQNELQLTAMVDAGGSSSQHHSRWQGFRLETEDGRCIAQFNQDGLVFSRLQPYENWERFATEGKRLWAVFCELGTISEVQRLAVRFINRIPLSRYSDVTLILKCRPEFLESFGLPMTGFFFASRHDVPQYPLQIEVVQTVQPPTPQQTEGFGLILDIDVHTTRAFECSTDAFDDYLSKMHWLKNEAFFALITRDAVSTLERKKP